MMSVHCSEGLQIRLHFQKQSPSILIILFNVLHDFIIGKTLLKFILTDQALEFLRHGMARDVLLVAVENLNDKSAAMKSIIIFLNQKCSSNKICCVEVNQP